MDFAAQGEIVKGVCERPFTIEVDGRTVPGILWTPAGASGPRPLVLVGHGGAGSKREDYVVALSRRVVRHHGFTACAIDGPVHGDRRDDGGANVEAVFADFVNAWAGDPELTDRMIADWRATLDALRTDDVVGEGPVGYWGLSMGTILGLPFVAAEPRIQAAVFGLMGVAGPTRERVVRDARTLRCPVMFVLQWDDELFPRSLSIDLFDAIASREKRLVAQPGLHAEVPLDTFEASERFLAAHLAVSDGA